MPRIARPPAYLKGIYNSSLARVRLLWDFLREALDANRAFLMGEARELVLPDAGMTPAGIR